MHIQGQCSIPLHTRLAYVQFYIIDFKQVADCWKPIIECLANRCDEGGVKTNEAEEKTVGTLFWYAGSVGKRGEIVFFFFVLSVDKK